MDFSSGGEADVSRFTGSTTRQEERQTVSQQVAAFFVRQFNSCLCTFNTQSKDEVKIILAYTFSDFLFVWG